MGTGIKLVLSQVICDSYVISIPIYIPMSHTRVAPYISVEHTTLDLEPPLAHVLHIYSFMFMRFPKFQWCFITCLSITFFKPPYPLVVTKVMFNLYHLRAQIRPI